MSKPDEFNYQWQRASGFITKRKRIIPTTVAKKTAVILSNKNGRWTNNQNILVSPGFLFHREKKPDFNFVLNTWALPAINLLKIEKLRNW
jgi:hypothetical protein